MSLNTIEEIERAIGALTPREIEELYAWLEQHCPPPIDTRVQSDLAAGRLDTAIQRASLEEEAAAIMAEIARLEQAAGLVA
jgi:hypothetical protein